VGEKHVTRGKKNPWKGVVVFNIRRGPGGGERERTGTRKEGGAANSKAFSSGGTSKEGRERSQTEEHTQKKGGK